MGSQFDPDYSQVTAIVIIAFNAISFIALLLVLMTYLLNFKIISNFPMRLSFYLCIACLIQNLYVLILNPILINKYQQESNTSAFCDVQAYLKVTFDLSSMIWTSLIMYSVYASIVHEKLLNSYEKYYLLIGYLLPALVAIVPITLNIYGYDTYYCWFNTQGNFAEQFWFKMGYYFIPLWVLFFGNLYFTIATFKNLKDIGLTKRQLQIFKRFMLFPFILFFTGTFSTAQLIIIYTTRNTPLWLDIVAQLFLSIYGLLNAIAYGLNPIIRQKLTVYFCGEPVKQEHLQPIRETVEMTQSRVSSSSSRNTQKLAQIMKLS